MLHRNTEKARLYTDQLMKTSLQALGHLTVYFPQSSSWVSLTGCLR